MIVFLFVLSVDIALIVPKVQNAGNQSDGNLTTVRNRTLLSDCNTSKRTVVMEKTTDSNYLCCSGIIYNI